MLRANCYFLDVDPLEAYNFITNAMGKKEFRLPQIREWITASANVRDVFRDEPCVLGSY